MRRDDTPTPNSLDPRDVFSWPLLIAMLERAHPRLPFACRLGTLALIQSCVRDMAQEDATGDRVAEMRELVEILAHLPWIERGS